MRESIPIKRSLPRAWKTLWSYDAFFHHHSDYAGIEALDSILLLPLTCYSPRRVKENATPPNLSSAFVIARARGFSITIISSERLEARTAAKPYVTISAS